MNMKQVPRFTLDTNCVIAVEENRSEAAAVRTLYEAHLRGLIELSVVAISASEKQLDGKTLQNFQEFIDRLTRIGLERCNIAKPMLYFDVCFFDWAYWGSDEMEKLEAEIHSILFPNIEFLWRDYHLARNLPEDTIDHKWRNAKCDTLALWSHIWHGGDVFATSDGNFHAATKRAPLKKLGVGAIEYPDQAMTIIPNT
jgi:hypothetical protein